VLVKAKTKVVHVFKPEVVGESAVSALICLRALASIVDTLEGLDVDGDLDTVDHPASRLTPRTLEQSINKSSFKPAVH